MRYLICFFVAFINLAAFGQDKISEESKVKEIVNTFFKHIAFERYGDAQEVCTEGTGRRLEMMKAFSAMMPDSIRLEVEKQLKVNQKATLRFSTIRFDEKFCYVSYMSSIKPKIVEKIALKKEEGRWLIDLETKVPTAKTPMKTDENVGAEEQ